MSELIERVQKATQGVERLTRHFEEQRQKVAKLTAEIHDQRSLIDTLKEKIDDLEKENRVLRTARSFENGSGGERSKERIDELVKEIDHCLALLNA